MNNGTSQPANGGYTSWYALPELVGRTQLLDQAVQALQSGKKRVAFLIGRGGIGKTRVLQAIIKKLHGSSAVQVVEREVDLYHTEMHTTNGLADALYQASPFLVNDACAKMYEQLIQQWVTGLGAGSADLRREHLDLFAKILSTACQQRPVVLALDTAERLIYGLPHLPDYLRQQMAGAWSWLLNLLDKNPNLRLLIAGRPAAEPLCRELEAKLGADLVLRLDIEPLRTDEGLAYFAAVEQEAQRREDTNLLLRLGELGEDLRRQAVQWAGGVPIRLALMIDYLAMGGALPDLTTTPQTAWEAFFFDQLRESPFYDILVALGRLPKGADPELVCRVLGCTVPTKGEVEKALTNDIRRFTFVKVLNVPGLGERYFLHDEMYRLFREQVFNRPTDAAAAERAYEAIADYYEEQLKTWRQETAALFRPVEDGYQNTVDGAKLSKLYRQQMALCTADVYYALRQDSSKGFRRRYRYTRDADLSGNVALDYALQAELLAFLGEQNGGRNGGTLPPEFEGLLMMRPVVRAWVEEDYERALTEAANLRQQADAALQDDLNAAILNTWEAYALIYLGRDLDKAENMLGEAIAGATQHLTAPNPTRAWRAKAILAFASRVRGYLYDGQERLDKAEEDYKRAVPLWREINLQIELATTLKDLAYSLGLKGEFDPSRRLVWDALDLYRNLASIGNVGLALNAQALIRLMDGDYQEAIEGSRRAWRLGQAIGNRRLQGLAGLALAEALRRSVGPGTLPPLPRKLEVLEEALGYAQEALRQMELTGERAYIIQAHIELGCNRRNLVHLCSEHPELGKTEAEIEAYKRESADWLREAAAQAAKIGNTGLQLDALVNLGWLGYFARDEGLIAEATWAVRQAAAALYPDPQAAHPRLTDANRHFISHWEQIGKHYTMRGGIAYRAFQAAPAQGKDHLVEAGRLWTYALFFNSLKGTNYDHYRRAKDFIYQRLRSLNKDELTHVAHGVIEAENDLEQKGSSLMRAFLQESFLWIEPSPRANGERPCRTNRHPSSSTVGPPVGA